MENLQDITADFYASLIAEARSTGQPVNRSTACVCSVCVNLKEDPEEQHTHTHGQPVNRSTGVLHPHGQPILPGSGGGELIKMPVPPPAARSRYDIRTRRKYAACHFSTNSKGEQVRLGEGWVIKSGNGEWDESIAEWLAEVSRPDPKKCPDCEGTGFVTATLFDNKGAQKCTHQKLQPS